VFFIKGKMIIQTDDRKGKTYSYKERLFI